MAYIGLLLRCAHKRIVNIMKVYIERYIPLQISIVFTFTFAKRGISRHTLRLQPISWMVAIGHDQINTYPIPANSLDGRPARMFCLY